MEREQHGGRHLSDWDWVAFWDQLIRWICEVLFHIIDWVVAIISAYFGADQSENVVGFLCPAKLLLETQLWLDGGPPRKGDRLMESCKAPRWGLRIMMGRATGINSRPKGGSCGSGEVQNYLWGGPSPGWVEKSFIFLSISLKRFKHRLFVHIICFKLKLSTLRRAINIIRYFKECAQC